MQMTGGRHPFYAKYKVRIKWKLFRHNDLIYLDLSSLDYNCPEKTVKRMYPVVTAFAL